MKNNDKPFFCYSKKLKDELSAIGIRYVSIGKHDKNEFIDWDLIKKTAEIRNKCNNIKL